MTEGIINIRKGREKPIRNQHPWIFSGAISNAVDADDGDIVKVVDHKGNFLGRGYWNHLSQIQVRIMTWQEDEEINEAWWRKMIQRAITNRYPKPEFYAGNRVINAENDFIPGLIVDRYSSFLVLQALTLHIDQQKHMIAELLAELFEQADMPIKGIYERSDVDVRGKEGLKASTGLLWGEEPPELIPFRDDNLIRMVDVRTGHKTGYYLDQRENHELVQELSEENSWTLDDNRILNTFSFSGGFGLRSTAHVVNVDSSEEALELAKHSYKSNEWREKDVDFIQADVFDYLRDALENDEEYDLVILDPPKFAQNKRQVDGAARGYKDINLNAFKIVKSGGYLMTFSCSGAISRDLFQKIVFGALADSGRQGQIVKHLSASSDHPIALTFPEGEYLKGLLVKVY